MTPVVHTKIPTNEILSQKKVFLLICLHHHLIDYKGKTKNLLIVKLY